MNTRFLLIASAAFLVAACGPAPSDDAAQPVSGDVAAAQVLPAVTSALVASSQPTVSSCSPVVAKISWDVSQQHPGVNNVQIFAGPESQPALFSAGGAKGSAETGEWTRPGTIFRVRDGASGEELSRIVIGGPVCAGGSGG